MKLGFSRLRHAVSVALVLSVGQLRAEPSGAAATADAHACSDIGGGVPAAPAEIEQARALHRSALAHAHAADYAAALREWQQAYELSERPLLLLNVAGAYQELGRSADALAALACFRRKAGQRASPVCLLAVDAWVEAVASTERALPASPADQPRSVSSFMCPGEAAAHEPQPAALPAPPSTVRTTRRPLDSPAPYGSSRRGATERTLGVALGIMSLGAFGVGTLYGLESMRKRDAADRQCTLGPTRHLCSAEGVAFGDEALSDGTRSTAFFTLGALVATTGALLFFLAPRPARERAELEVVTSIGRQEALLSASGRF